MSDLENKVVDIINQLQSLAQPAMQIALTSVRIGGLLDLACGVLCAGIAAFAIRTCISQVRIANDNDTGNDIPHIIAAVATGLVSVGFSTATCINLLDTFNWLCAFRPDLALAQMMLHRL